MLINVLRTYCTAMCTKNLPPQKEKRGKKMRRRRKKASVDDLELNQLPIFICCQTSQERNNKEKKNILEDPAISDQQISLLFSPYSEFEVIGKSHLFINQQSFVADDVSAHPRHHGDVKHTSECRQDKELTQPEACHTSQPSETLSDSHHRKKEPPVMS